MPLLGAHARWEVRCGGREYTGEFDDCFNDYLPLLELAAPVLGLILLWFFARFSFTMWAPAAERRHLRWHLASRSEVAVYWPVPHIAAALGMVWAFWQASAYGARAVGTLFLLFWTAFGVWFAVGAFAAWPSRADRVSTDGDQPPSA